MIKRLLALAILVAPAASAAAQAAEVLPKWLKIELQGQLELRYVDFGWAPEAFTAMEQGGQHPAAGRDWMLAILRFGEPLRFEGRTIPVGPALLVLEPKRGDAPMTLELREVDVRDMLFEPNVIGTPPAKGERIKSRPAGFAVVPEMAERLDMKLTPSGRDTLLTIRFGDRKTELLFKARE